MSEWRLILISHYLTRCLACAVIAHICWYASLSGADLDDGLVAYYPFEGSGQQFEDAAENSLDGNLQTAKRERQGKFGKGLLFANKNAQAQVPRSPVLVVKKDFSVVVWVFPTKLDFAGENRVVFTDQYNLDLLRGGGRLDLFSGGGWQGTNVGPALELETWHHIAGTFESKEKTGAFYVNGKLVSNGKTAADQLTQIQSPLRLGSCCGLAGFVGVLDELRIYDRALDDKEIEQLFGYNPGVFSVSPVGALSVIWGNLKVLQGIGGNSSL